TGKLVRKLSHWYHARAVAFFPDGRHVATTWEHGNGTIWEIETGQIAAALQSRGEGQSPDALAVSPDGTRLLTCASGLLEWENPIRGEPTRAPPPDRRHTKPVRGGAPRIGFSPLGTYVCVAEWHLWLYAADTLEVRRQLWPPGSNASAATFAFTPD